jgi:ABC-type amino acid transport substrate-binding protein
MKEAPQAGGSHDGVRPAEKVLTVGVDESPPPPLCFGLPDGPDFRGFEVDLLRAIASKLGMTLRCRSALWSAAIAALESGRLDMLCTAATITPQRRQVVDFSDPYFDAELVLVVRRRSPILSMDDLAGQTIGVRVATVAEEFVRHKRVKLTSDAPLKLAAPLAAYAQR